MSLLIGHTVAELIDPIELYNINITINEVVTRGVFRNKGERYIQLGVEGL